jgi:hypothetical protein
MSIIAGYGAKNGKNLDSSNSLPFLVMDEWLSWPRWLLHRVISVSGTLGDIGSLDTIQYSLAHKSMLWVE